MQVKEYNIELDHKEDWEMKIDAFKLWCWRRPFRVPCTPWRLNQWILRKSVLHNHLKDWCWYWSSNTLATWCDKLTHWKRHWWKDWRQEEKGMAEDEVVGWDNQLNEHEFKQTLEDSEGQGSLACCSLWGCKESETTKRLNNNFKICFFKKGKSLGDERGGILEATSSSTASGWILRSSSWDVIQRKSKLQCVLYNFC